MAATTAATNQALLANFGPDLELTSPSTGQSAKAVELLANKMVLLYFSAQWCGPCKRFTPLLKTLYTELKTHRAGTAVEDFELVFCSLDKTPETFADYSKDMPWWCLSFQSSIVGTLANLYAGGELAIPLLVVIDANGIVLGTDGVGQVTVDPSGARFPWRPARIVDLLPDQYLMKDDDANNNNGIAVTTYSVADLNDKFLMLYFSAHWCPPCKKFTPKLSAAYLELKKVRSDFELIFVSSDRDQRGFDEYYSTMPFGALIFEDREAKTNICSRLKVRSIPHLVMLGPCSAGDGGDRQIINDNLRSIFDTGDYLRDFPYVPKRYGDLNKTVDNINSFRCVIVFCENGDDEEQESVQSILRQCAESTAATELSSMRWLWADAPTGLAKKIREVLKFGAVGSDQPVLVLLDIPNQGSYYIGPSATTYDLSVESVLDFVNNPGDRHQL